MPTRQLSWSCLSRLIYYYNKIVCMHMCLCFVCVCVSVRCWIYAPDTWIFEIFISFYLFFYFLTIFSLIFVQVIHLFHDNIWKNALIFINFSLFERSPFHLGTIVNFVAMRECKVCLSVALSTCLGYKSSKNQSILMEFGYVFAVTNFCLYTKNCDNMLDTFYRDTSKS